MTNPDGHHEPPEDTRGRAADRRLALRHRNRLLCCASALVLTGLAITACSGGGAAPGALSPTTQPSSGGSAQSGGTQAVSTPHPAGVGGHTIKAQPAPTHHVSLVLNNGKIPVCSLISGSQVNQIMGRQFPQPVPVAVGTFNECATASSAAPALRVAWAIPPESQPSLVFKQLTINLPRSDVVQGVGGSAYCSSTRPASAQLFSLDGRTLLEVFADTCGHATALAQAALSRV
jgi:hypothetical protein